MSTQYLTFDKGLSLPVVEDEKMDGMSVTMGNPRNRTYHNVRSDLHVSKNVVTKDLVTETLDVKDILNSAGTGVRILDQRLGQARYAVDERELQMSYSSPLTLPKTDPAVLFYLPFDTVGLEGLGVTQQIVDDAQGAVLYHIPLPDSGIYAVSTRIIIDEYQDTGGLPTYLFSVETRRLTRQQQDLNVPTLVDSDIINYMRIRRVPGDPVLTHSNEGTAYVNITNTNQRQDVVVMVSRDAVTVPIPDNTVPILGLEVRVVMLSAL
uniref:Uncharacterized protein n=1 Tax=Clandestinovirus TaxID=2831644 RepID=A0A8F8KT63_9VIRU|nr:hypothetical protein KOM_12_346 [Clandestinovirus]